MGKRKKKPRPRADAASAPAPVGSAVFVSVPQPSQSSPAEPAPVPEADRPIVPWTGTLPDPETISPDVPAGPEFLPPRGPEGPATVGGLALRMGWLIVGPSLLFVIGASILVERLRVGSWADGLYLAVAGGIVTLHNLEIKRGVPDRAVLPGNNGAFAWRLVVGAGIGLIAVHLLGASLPAVR